MVRSLVVVQFADAYVVTPDMRGDDFKDFNEQCAASKRLNQAAKSGLLSSLKVCALSLQRPPRTILLLP